MSVTYVSFAKGFCIIRFLKVLALYNNETLEFDRLFDIPAVDVAVKFQSDWKSLNLNLAVSRLRENLR